MTNLARTALRMSAVLIAGLLGLPAAQAADPIRIGTGLALTGGGAPAGKMLLAALEIWRDDINAKGGLLGRPVEVVITTTRARRRTCRASTPS